MTAMCATKSTQSGYCSTSAAAGTSMRIARILDTAVLAVSVFLILSVVLLVG
ncbi:MAG: hypothetical protein IIU86_05470 [Oscillospiraceae bacterium]|nr:hypothetical protein [Oscillospiraceae bacterium]